jgi:hypothetical protein
VHGHPSHPWLRVYTECSAQAATSGGLPKGEGVNTPPADTLLRRPRDDGPKKVATKAHQAIPHVFSLSAHTCCTCFCQT